MYLLVARYYIIRALVTPPGETNARKKWGYMQKQQSKTKKNTMQMQVINTHTHTHTHIYVCIYVCIYIYMCVCAYKYKLIYELVLEEVTFYRTQS